MKVAIVFLICFSAVSQAGLAVFCEYFNRTVQRPIKDPKTDKFVLNPETGELMTKRVQPFSAVTQFCKAAGDALQDFCSETCQAYLKDFYNNPENWEKMMRRGESLKKNETQKKLELCKNCQVIGASDDGDICNACDMMSEKMKKKWKGLCMQSCISAGRMCTVLCRAFVDDDYYCTGCEAIGSSARKTESESESRLAGRITEPETLRPWPSFEDDDDGDDDNEVSKNCDSGIVGKGSGYATPSFSYNPTISWGAWTTKSWYDNWW